MIPGILRSLILAAALIPGAWYAWEWRSMPHAAEYHDDGIYYVSAKSLAETGRYRIDSLPGQAAQTKYPPLWPAELSLAWRIEPNYPANLPWAMALCWLCLPLSVVFYRKWLREAGFGPNSVVLLCLLWALNPYVVLFSTTMLSEMQFTFLLLAALLCLRDGGPKWAAAAGALAALAFLSRTAGIALLPVGLGFYLLRNRRKEAAVFAATLLPVLAAWIVWSGVYRSPDKDPLILYYTNYVGYYLATMQWNEFPLYLWKNADGMVHGLGSMLLPDVTLSVFDKVLAETLALAGIVGVFRAVRTSRQSPFLPYAAFALIYSLMLVVWNFQPNERFMLPLAPLWLAGFVLEMARLRDNVGKVFQKKQFSQKVAGAIMAGLVCLVLGLGGMRQWQLLTEGLPQFYEKQARRLKDSEAAMEWIRGNLPADARILSNNDPLLYLRTGRRGVAPFRSTISWYRSNEEEMIAAIAATPELALEQRMNYFILNDWDFGRDMPPEAHAKIMKSLRSDPRLEKIFESPHSAVYRVRRP